MRAEGFFSNLDVLYGGLEIGKLQFLIQKNRIFFPAVFFLQFLVIKALDPDWIRIGIQPTIPDPDEINTDPQPCPHPPSPLLSGPDPILHVCATGGGGQVRVLCQASAGDPLR